MKKPENAGANVFFGPTGLEPERGGEERAAQDCESALRRRRAFSIHVRAARAGQWHSEPNGHGDPQRLKPAAPSSGPEIAYIIKGYPRLSEAFITNEIYLLETCGLRLQLFVVKQEKEAKSHALVGKIRAPVHYLPPVTSLTAGFFLKWLWQNLPKFTRAHRLLIRNRPLPYLRALLRAGSYCLLYRSRRLSLPKKAYLKEFLQAGYIACEALRLGTIKHIHAHFCHGATTIAMFAGELSGIPFSFTAHAKDIYHPGLNPGTLLRTKLRRAKFAVTCTRANGALLQRIGDKRTPVHVIYHGLDTEKFLAGLPRNGARTPRILAVGRFIEKKGFRYLIEACRILKARGVRFRCAIVGEPGDQSGLIRQLRCDFGLENEIALHGPMTHPELIEMYRQSDIMTLPCVIAEDGDRDGIPNVLAEAMAMSLPVVSTWVSGIPELVSHGHDGLLVPEKDANALAAALQKLLEHGALRRRLGRAGRAKVCRIFDARQNTARLKRLFDGVLQEEFRWKSP